MWSDRTDFPAIVKQKSAVDKITDNLKDYAAIFIEGRPLSGKTSLLLQLNCQITTLEGGKVCSIEFKNEVDLKFALKEISKNLGISVQSTEPSPDEFVLQDLILDFLERNKFCLMVDNIDRIHRWELLFEFLVKNLRSGRLVSSGTHTPKIDPALAMDFRIHQHHGLTEEEIEKLIQQSSVSMPENSKAAILRRLFELTCGNPYLVKLILSPAILEKRSLVESDLHKNILDTETYYFKKIYNSLEVGFQRILSQTALLKYSENFESKLLKTLSSSVLNRLFAAGFINRMNGVVVLTTDFRTFLTGIHSKEIVAYRIDLCERLTNENSYEDRKELLSQLNALQRYSEAADTFNQIAFELRERGESIDIAELSEPIKNSITLTAFESRATALQFLEKLPRLKDDIQSRLSQTESDLEATRLYLLLSDVMSSLGETNEAMSCVEKALNLCQGDTPLGVEALLMQVKYKRLRNAEDALTILKRVEELFRNFENPSDELLARFHSEYFFCLNIIGQFQQCLEHALLANRYFSKSKNGIRELWSRMNLAIARYNFGFISQSLNDVNCLLILANRFGLKMIKETCLRIQASQFGYQGRYKEAEALWVNIDLGGASSKITINQWRIWQSVLEVMPKSGMFAETVTVLNEFLTLDFTKMDESWSCIGREMRSSLESVLVKDFKNIVRPIPEQLNDEDRAFLINFQLEVHWGNFAPVGISRQLDFSGMGSCGLVSVPYKMVYRGLSALHYLLEGQFKRAESLLTSSIEFFRDAEYFIWELRGLLGLSIIDLHHGRLRNAIDRLARAEALVKKIDPCHEIDLCFAIQALAYLKSNKQSEFETSLNRIRPESPYAYFHHVLLPFKMSKNEAIFSIVGIEPHQRNFFDRIIDLIDCHFLSKVQIQTRHGTFTCFGSAIPTSLEKENDLIYDQIRNLVRVGKLIIPLKEKETLSGLLKFFLAHPSKIFSKEELTVHIWHEKYDSLVHDVRIYTSIRRLRGLFNHALKSDIISTREGSYSLSSKINYVIISSEPSSNVLSDRQTWILKYLEINGSIDRLTAQKLLRTSRTPIMNEINSLIRRGLIQSMAKGKLTKYKTAVG